MFTSKKLITSFTRAFFFVDLLRLVFPDESWLDSTNLAIHLAGLAFQKLSTCGKQWRLHVGGRLEVGPGTRSFGRPIRMLKIGDEEGASLHEYFT